MGREGFLCWGLSAWGLLPGSLYTKESQEESEGRHCWFSHLGPVRGSYWQRPGTLLNGLRCTGQPLTPARQRRVQMRMSSMCQRRPSLPSALLLQVPRSWNTGRRPGAGTGQVEAGPSLHCLGPFPLARRSVKRGGAPRAVSSRWVPRRFGCREDQSSICVLTGRVSPKTPTYTLAHLPRDHPSPWLLPHSLGA